MVKEIIDKAIEGFLQKALRERSESVFYPSELGWCIRKTWFQYKSPKLNSIETLKLFEAGNLIHNWFTNILFNAYSKDIIQDFEYEKSIVYNGEDFQIRGRADDVIVLKTGNDLNLLEVKTARRIDMIRNVNAHHFTQVNFYMNMLRLEKAYMVYIDRRDLKYKILEVKIDKERFNEMVKRAAHLLKFLKENKLPLAEANLNKDENWQCDYCDYRLECAKNDAQHT